MKNATKITKTKNRSHERELRRHVLDLLAGEGAHAKFEQVASGIPSTMRGTKPTGFLHSAWMLLEHMRITQGDILEFSRNPKHVSPDWPAGYWPQTEAPRSAAAWDKSVQQFLRDLRAMQELVERSETDLFARIPWGEGQTILREALLMADHNAYHLGQLVVLRRVLGVWPK
jgi:uncharacterized damage-inducible protein DinB